METGMSNAIAQIQWAGIAGFVVGGPPHKEWRVWKDTVEPPAEADYRPSSGAGFGQISDWRSQLEDGRGIHVREYDDHWMVHWDVVDPGKSLVGHARRDYPPGFIAGCVGTGVTAGVMVGGAVGGMLGGAAGAILGVLVGLAAAAFGLELD